MLNYYSSAYRRKQNYLLQCMNLIVIAVIKLSFYAVYVDWQWQPRNVYFYQQRNLQNVLAV